MKNPELATTDRMPCNVFLHNEDALSSNMRPLLIFQKGVTLQSSHFLPLKIFLKAETTGSEVPTELTASFEIYLETDPSRPVKTRKRTIDPAPTADSLEGLQSTGSCRVDLPIPAMEATTYLCRERISCTLVFVILYLQTGEAVPELENAPYDEIFEGGIFSGRLKKHLRDRGIAYHEAARVFLPAEEPRNFAERSSPRKRLRLSSKQHEKEATVVVVDDSDCGDNDGRLIHLEKRATRRSKV
jgi:hypothetical protein